MKQGATGLIPTLDGWRAIAILSVIFCHLTGALFAQPESAPSRFLYDLMVRGYVGVDIFFGISGFLICTRLLDDEKEAGRVDLIRFYIRRFFRILPPYLFYLIALTLLSGPFGLNVPWKSIAASTVFLQNYWIPASEIHWNLGHLWSLAVEEHFYLFFPWVLFFTQNRNRRRLPSLLILSLFFVIWRILDFRLEWGERLFGPIGFYTRTDIKINGLLMGASFAVWIREEAIRERCISFFRNRFARYLPMTLFVLNEIFLPRMSLVWREFLIPWMLFSTISQPKSFFSRVLSSRILSAIGVMSYSLYLWNNFFLPPIGLEISSFGKNVLQIPFSFALLFAVAWTSHRFLEKPLIRLGRRLTERMRLPGRTETLEKRPSLL